jgi:hypothetical protein
MPPPPKYNICSHIEDGDEDVDTGAGMDVEMDVGMDELNSNADPLALCQRWQQTLQNFFFGTPPQVSKLNLSLSAADFLHKCRLKKSNHSMRDVFLFFKKCGMYNLQHTSSLRGEKWLQ